MCILALTVALAAQEQKPAPPFRTEAELVLVDAVVVDGDGMPVTGLAAADFEVDDDGERRTIELFQPAGADVDRRAAATASGTRRFRYATNVGLDAKPSRAFVVFFDDVHLTREDGDRAKTAIRAFLDGEVRDGDLVSLVAPGQALRWHARMPEGRNALLASVATLKGAYVADNSTERMSDYEAYRIHVFQDEAAADRVDRRWQNFRVLGREPTDLSSDKGFQPQNRGGGAGIIKQDIAIRASALYAQLAARNQATLAAIGRTIDALAPVRGRKSLILVSPGFIADQERRDQRQVLDTARRANVAVYFVDTRGIVTGSGFGQAQYGAPLDARDVGAANADPTLEAEGAEALSSQSGGFSIRNSNDLAGALRRIGRESASYYLLGFRPVAGAKPGTFRRIEVRVAKPGVRVRARRGYVVGGVQPEAGTGRRNIESDDLTRATDSPYELAAIPLQASAFVFGNSTPDRALTLLAVEADLRAFALARQPSGGSSDTLELRVIVTALQTGVAERYERDVEMSFPAAARFDADAWRSEVAEFRLAPGRYQARIAVRDRNSGRIGSLTHDFEVPALDGFRVTSPIVTDTIETGAALSGAPPKPVLLVRRTFPAGATLYYQFNVLGAGGGTAPRVTAGHEVRNAAGAVVKRLEPRTIAPSPQGGLSRFSGISLAGLPAGDYELVLRVTDETSGRTLELQEPFVLQPLASAGAIP